MPPTSATPQLADLQLFVLALQAGSLSAAGRTLGISPAVASKRLTRLESSLGVRLLQRSSRRLQLTAEGAAYRDRIAPLLAELHDAGEALRTQGKAVRGALRIATTHAFGRRWLGPLAAEFGRDHAHLHIHLALHDGLVDLIDGGYDLAIRIGRPEDSSLIGRRIAGNRRLIVAAPAYLQRHGTPTRPADLRHHQCLSITGSSEAASWTFHTADGALNVEIAGALSSDNGELIHDWALQGLGLARKSIWDVAADLHAGRLHSVLDDYAAPAADIYALYPSRRQVPLRVRRFIEHLETQLANAARTLPFGPSP